MRACAAWSGTAICPAIPAAEVFALYKRNWRHVDTTTLAEAERRVIADLASRFGGGILLP